MNQLRGCSVAKPSLDLNSKYDRKNTFPRVCGSTGCTDVNQGLRSPFRSNTKTFKSEAILVQG